jgi:hypothetical protein
MRNLGPMIDGQESGTSLILSGGKAADFDAGELAELARELVNAIGDEVSVGLAEERASGPLPDEVLHVALTFGRDYAIGKLLDATLDWARRRWRRRRDEAAASGGAPPPTVVHFEGRESIVFRLDLPDGEPLTWSEPVTPRGRRRSAPRWIAGPAAPPVPEDPDAAWILPVTIAEPDAAGLRDALSEGSFDLDPFAAPPAVTISRDGGGPPMETIVRVMIAAPEREFEAIAAIGRWSHSRPEADGRPYLSTASVIDTTGKVLRRLVISPIPDAARRVPKAGISPSVRAALLDLDMIAPEDFEVDLWHATDPGAAEAIIAEQLLHCDGNGVAYLSSSPTIAAVLGATGVKRPVLLRLRVPLAVLDISKDWRPGEARVDFHFLCGEFFGGAVTVTGRRDL